MLGLRRGICARGFKAFWIKVSNCVGRFPTRQKGMSGFAEKRFRLHGGRVQVFVGSVLVYRHRISGLRERILIFRAVA